MVPGCKSKYPIFYIDLNQEKIPNYQYYYYYQEMYPSAMLTFYCFCLENVPMDENKFSGGCSELQKHWKMRNEMERAFIIHTPTHMHTRIETCINACTHLHTYIRMHTHIHTYVCILVYYHILYMTG